MEAPPQQKRPGKLVKRKPVANSPILPNYTVLDETQSPTTLASSELPRRKPVPGLSPTDLVQSPTSISTAGGGSYDSSLFDDYVDDEAEQLRRAHLSEEPDRISEEFDSFNDSALVEPHRPEATPIQQTSSTDGRSTQRSRSGGQVVGSFLKSAYGEARHFAGGLVAHPYESTRHFSILRHSHGLVFYSGSYTNLAITVFSDRDLPPDRTFWLQRRGWSGKTGLGIGASVVGIKNAWIDVTPSVSAAADDLKPSDERAWQRDIRKFLRKAPNKIRHHIPRETNILRIPCHATDGYLRVVMCSGERGKKTLCPSPIFRLASTSTSPSSIKGASLSTLPVEVAMKAGHFAAKKAVTVFTGPYVNTAQSYVTGQLGSIYQPSWLTQEAAQVAASTTYDTTVKGKVNNMNKQYQRTRDSPNGFDGGTGYIPIERLVLIGDESGPMNPFPIRFHGKVVPGTGNSTTTLGIPTANLENVNSDITWKHSGIFFGYAALNLPNKLREETSLDNDWHEAIVSIVPAPDAQAKVVQKKTVRVHIIEDFEGAKFFDAKVSVMLMGFLRPVPHISPGQEVDLEMLQSELYHDIAATQASLSRPAWAAEETLDRVKSAASTRSFSERYIDARMGVQNKFDKVPSHKLGIRMDGTVRRDRWVGNGGVCVKR